MAASATTVMVVFIATTAATCVTTSAAMVASASAAFAAHQPGGFGQFFIGSRAVFQHLAYKVQVASCIRMVEVYRYFVCADGCYFAADTFAFGSHEGKNGTHFHVFFVKLAVDVEDFL